MKHYIAMAGLCGCMPQYCEDRLRAVSSLAAPMPIQRSAPQREQSEQ